MKTFEVIVSRTVKELYYVYADSVKEVNEIASGDGNVSPEFSHEIDTLDFEVVSITEIKE